MSTETPKLKLPPFDDFIEVLQPLDLSFPPAELHAVMAAYVAAGHANDGEAYLRALFQNEAKQASRLVLLAVFSVFTVTQHQLNQLDLNFELMLPLDDEPLAVRAKCFSEWCAGFVHGLDLAEVDLSDVDDEEVQDALQHMIEFSQMDYSDLDVSEEDERAFVEVVEYARMAVIRIRDELQGYEGHKGQSQITH